MAPLCLFYSRDAIRADDAGRRAVTVVAGGLAASGDAFDAAADGQPGGARAARRRYHAHEEHRAHRAGKTPGTTRFNRRINEIYNFDANSLIIFRSPRLQWP